MLPLSSRFAFTEVPARHPGASLQAVVMEGLCRTEKRLDCRFFYDSTGSHLFERICRLPEYYLTRAEHALLERHAAEIVCTAGQCVTLIEFGSGSSVKTRLLLEAALERQPTLHYTPIDISADFLRSASLQLLKDYDRLFVAAIAAEYEDGIEALPERDGPRLLVFLGSNIGNFTPAEALGFLKRVQRRMRPQDSLLLGIDLLKDPAIIEAAYNDAEGVTEQFNKNLLVRINRELQADFDLAAFTHHAPFLESPPRIEMRLVSLRRQTVRIRGLRRDFVLEQGESIHTENSHKYTVAGAADLCGAAGLALAAQWIDEQNLFGLLLLRPRTRPDACR